ncbi:MAG: universal stress protein [Vibrio sp.]
MYNNILVPVDFNEKGFCDKAVAQAVWLAKQSGSQLHLLTVVPGIHLSMVASYFPKEAAHKMKIETSERLQDFAKQHVDDEIACHTYVAEGRPYTTIIEYAEQHSIDLIIMPSHKRSTLNRVVLGSVASKVVEHSPVHVLVVKPTA